MLIGNVQVVAGGPERIPDVLAYLAKEGVQTLGNADLYAREYRQFGIDEAREIRERASRRALASAKGSRRIFLITAATLTNEAQNALLKTLEDGVGNALFVFVVPSPHTLLGTVRSRAQILTLDSASTRGAVVDPEAFLAATPAQRLDMLKILLERGDDDTRDVGAVVAFLSSLESIFARTIVRSPENGHTSIRQGLKSLYLARAYITDKGAMLKPLLEQFALLSPTL